MHTTPTTATQRSRSVARHALQTSWVHGSCRGTQNVWLRECACACERARARACVCDPLERECSGKRLWKNVGSCMNRVAAFCSCGVLKARRIHEVHKHEARLFRGEIGYEVPPGLCEQARPGPRPAIREAQVSDRDSLVPLASHMHVPHCIQPDGQHLPQDLGRG